MKKCTSTTKYICIMSLVDTNTHSIYNYLGFGGTRSFSFGFWQKPSFVMKPFGLPDNYVCKMLNSSTVSHFSIITFLSIRFWQII